MTQLEKIKETILKNRPELSEKSVNQYASNVSSTLKSMKLEFSLEDILKKHEQIFDFLKNKYSDITFRNKLNSFFILFGTEDKLKHKDIFDKWTNERNQITQNYIDEHKDKERSSNEVSNWINKNEYSKVLDNESKIINKIYKTNDFSQMNINKITNYMIACFFEELNIRADLENVLIVNDPLEMKNKTKNYFILRKTKPKYTLILNEYKTAKTNGSLSIDVDTKRLNKELPRYLKMLNNHVIQKDGLKYLFWNVGLTDTIRQSQISTQFKNFFLERTKKTFTIQLNRKRLISEDERYIKLNELKEELQNVAKDSGHSVNVAESLYFKDLKKEKEKTKKVKSKK
jgi:hypothetical protein